MKKIWNAEEKLQYERALQAKGYLRVDDANVSALSLTPSESMYDSITMDYAILM